MPVYRFDPTGLYAPDRWGWNARPDFVANINGRTGLYGVSGSSPDPNEAIVNTRDEALAAGHLFTTAQAALASLGPRPGGPTQSENAYNASLAAQGINPAELPLGTSGQIATARVQSQHGLPIASWLQPFLAKALAAPAPVAGTNVGFGPPGNPLGITDQNPPFTGAPAANVNIAPDFFAPLANATNPLTQLRNAELAATSAAPKQTSVYSQLRNAILQRFGVAPTTIARPY